MSSRIAIIGGGITGLTAAYLLTEKYDIALFEKSHRVGGNAYTYKARNGELFDIAVAALNKRASPNFYEILSRFKTRMCIRPLHTGVSLYNLETREGIYPTFWLKGLLAQRFAIFRRQTFLRAKATNQFRMKSRRLFREGKLDGLTIEESIKLVSESNGKPPTLLMALYCLISSMHYSDVLKAPADFFVKKEMANLRRHMLNLRMPKDHTASYVNAMASHFKDRIVLNSKITSVARSNEGITLKMDNGQQLPFDKIIFACNPDQALSLLEKSTDQEKRLLGAWKYLNGRIVVHTDSSYLPRRELCQSWTCLQSTENGQPHFSISGCTWMLPGVSSNSKYISTQHPNFPIRDDLVEFETVLRTPIFDHDSVRTIEDLPTLNGTMNSYYCGSYFGSGLHEAAVASAIAVARDLDVDWK